MTMPMPMYTFPRGSILLLACLCIASQLILQGHKLCIQFLPGGSTTTARQYQYPRSSSSSSPGENDHHGGRQRVDLSQCPGIPKAPKNETIVSEGKPTFDRPKALQELLSTPRMKMPSAHNITGLRIAFAGDSVTRYLSMALTFYLQYNEWITDEAKPNVLFHPTFDSWDIWSHYSVNKLFGQERYACDCFGPPALKGHFENRFYQDTCRGNYVSYIAKMGTLPTKGHWLPQENFTQPDVYANLTMLESPAPLWQYDTWADVLNKYITQLIPKPDYLVINEGLWPKHGFSGINDEQNGTSVFHEIKRVLDEHGIHGIYKTTTTRKRKTDARLEPFDAVGCKVMHSCILSNWTAPLFGAPHYEDQVHFRPHVNRWMAEQMWDHLAQLENERQQVIETDSVAEESTSTSS